MFDINQTILLVMDIQTRLIDKMQQPEQVVENSLKLIKAAKILTIPIIATEQVPEKLGSTIDPILAELDEIERVSKVTFSCCTNENFNQVLKDTKRQQIIIVGIESHVCIYQTVVDLLQQSYQVQVVVDATSSRDSLNKEISQMRMKDLGCTLTTSEMIITELLKTSEHPSFRDVLQIIK